MYFHPKRMTFFGREGGGGEGAQSFMEFLNINRCIYSPEMRNDYVSLTD